MNNNEIELLIENMGLWASAVTAPLPPGGFTKRTPVAMKQWLENYEKWHKSTQEILSKNRKMRDEE